MVDRLSSLLNGRRLLAAAGIGAAIAAAPAFLAARETAASPAILAIPQSWFYALFIFPVLLVLLIGFVWSRVDRQAAGLSRR